MEVTRPYQTRLSILARINDLQHLRCQEEIKNSTQVLVSAPEVEIAQRIKSLRTANKAYNNLSNIQEFCEESSGVGTCARANARLIPRKTQLKTKRVENLYGPLCPAPDNHKNSRLQGVEERLSNIEAHLELPPSQEGQNMEIKELFERIKRCEDRILKLEELGPCKDLLAYLKEREQERQRNYKEVVGKGSVVTSVDHLPDSLLPYTPSYPPKKKPKLSPNDPKVWLLFVEGCCCSGFWFNVEWN